MPETSLRLKLLALAPVWICIALAGVHMYSMYAHDASPWHVAGFGMFATTDNSQTRYFQAYRLTPDGEQAFRVPVDLGMLNRSVRILPSPRRMQRFADRLAAHPAAQGHPVRIELYGTEYDRATMHARSREIARATGNKR